MILTKPYKHLLVVTGLLLVLSFRPARGQYVVRPRYVFTAGDISVVIPAGLLRNTNHNLSVALADTVLAVVLDSLRADGATRVCSKIGGGMAGVIRRQEEDQVRCLGRDYGEQYERHSGGIRRTIQDCLGADPQIVGSFDFRLMLVNCELVRDDPEPAFFYHSDHLGSAAYLTLRGGVIQTLNYLPYGEDWVEQNNFAPADTTDLGICRFNGKERDYESISTLSFKPSGLHWHGVRKVFDK